MTITNTGRRVALVGLVAIIAALMPLSAASAAHLTGVTQLTAEDNVHASIAWSTPGGFPTGGLESGARDPEYVLIGRDDIFPDNLASGALQTAGVDEDGDGPLLLTETDSLNQDVVREIERLGVDRAIILGQIEAISQAVEDQLGELVTQVDRLGGTSRIETAIDVTRESGASTAILARAFDEDGGDTSQAFADSLAAGAWAADEGYGVLLTQTDTLTGSVADYLAEGDIDEIIIVGGTDAVSDDVQAAVDAIDGVEVRRVAGENRAATAIEIAEERGYDFAEDAPGVILVEGYLEDSWASGFPAAATSALEDYPIVLSNGDGLPPETDTFAAGDPLTTDMDTTTDGSGNIDLVCGPLMPGAGPDTDGDNVTEDLAPACEEFAEVSGAQTTVSGTVSAVDTDENRFEIVTDADTGTDSTVQTVIYTDDDTFTVDGEDVSVEEFEAEIDEGDTVVVTEVSGRLTIDLTNEDADGLPVPIPVPLP